VIVKKAEVHGEGGAATQPPQSEKAGGTAP
jgi:hypothetical protein